MKNPWYIAFEHWAPSISPKLNKSFRSISINPNANWYRADGHDLGVRGTVFSVHEAEISGFGIQQNRGREDREIRAAAAPVVSALVKFRYSAKLDSK